MRLLLVHAHPNPQGFTAAVRDAVLAGAQARGAEARLIDLCAEGFDPRLTAAEWASYATPNLPPDLAAHLAHLHWADTLVFTAPVWWGSVPPVLRGWVDRLFRPGIAFDVAGGRLTPCLTNIRTMVLVTSTGAPWAYWRLIRRSPERDILRAIAPCVHPRARQVHLALHGIDTTTPAHRSTHLAKVTARITTL